MPAASAAGGGPVGPTQMDGVREAVEGVDDLAGLFGAAPGETHTGSRHGGITVLVVGLLAITLVAVVGIAVLRGRDEGEHQSPDRQGPMPQEPQGAAPPGGPPAPAGSPPEAAPPSHDVGAEAVGAVTPAAAHPTPAGSSAGSVPAVDVLERVAVQAVRAAPTASPRHLLDAVAVRSSEVGTVTIVEVAAVGIHARGESWGPPQALRFGVAVDRTQAVALAPPWPLPSSRVVAPDWQAVSDDALAAAVEEALREAGFEDLPEDGSQAIALSRGTQMPGVLRAELPATAPGAEGPTQQELWFHDEERPRLLGAGG